MSRSHEHSDEQSTKLQVIRADDCPAQPVEWLWPGKIPIGKVTLLIGDPGVGKSLVTLDIAARASRLAPWPDESVEGQGSSVESKNPRSGPRPATLNPQPSSDHSSFLPPPSLLDPWPSSAVLLSATDDLADTIRPRLDAAGADPQRIFVIPSLADLRKDFEQLRAAADSAPNCRLIIIDPINAYVGPSDSHFQTVVRKVLEPLAQFAAKRRIAVLAVAHLRKTDGAAIHRAAGSMGFVAAARAVWTISRDSNNPDRHLLLPIKNNLSATAPGLAFTIQTDARNSAPRLVWDAKPITAPAEEVLRGPGVGDLNSARKWLRQALAHGPRAALDIADEAEQHGFHKRTLRRALHAIGGHTQNRGLFDGWWWSLPTATTKEPTEEAAASKTDDGSKTESTASAVPIPHSAFPIPHSDAPLPPSPEPVPLCPLPEIINDPPLHDPSPTPATVAESIAFLDRIYKRRAAHRRKTTRKPKSRPTKTGNPILDASLDALRLALSSTATSSPQSHPTDPKTRPP